MTTCTGWPTCPTAASGFAHRQDQTPDASGNGPAINCYDELARVDARFRQITGQRLAAHYSGRPAAKTSPALVRAALECGYMHVELVPAGFLGDEFAKRQVSPMHNCLSARCAVRPGDIPDGASGNLVAPGSGRPLCSSH